MLCDHEDRLNIEELLELPIIKFYRYLLYEKECDFANVVNDFRSLPAFLSGLI